MHLFDNQPSKKMVSVQRATILLITTNADLAGAPLHVQDLAIALAASTKRLVVVFGEEGAVRNNLDELGIDTRIIPMRSDFNLANDLRSVAAMCRLIDEIQPDALHAHSAKAGMVARIAGAIKKAPVIYTVHGWGFGPGRRKIVSAILRVIERLLRPLTSVYIMVSGRDAETARQDLNIAPARIRTIHNGIPVTDTQAAPGTAATVVMVARHSHPKDYETLFRSMQATGRGWALLCVGTGTDTEDFRSLASATAPGQHRYFQFLGCRADVEAVLSNAAVFVLSSKFEGLPISIIEAMRAGLPIVATDVGGIGELVQAGINGYLVPAGDSDAMAHALSQLMDEPQKRIAMGRESRRLYLEYFTAETMLKKTIDVYTEVLSTKEITNA